jgi:hypothetical protein
MPASNPGQKAPEPAGDPSRELLFSTTYIRIGIDAVRDSKGVLWISEEFVN